MVFRHKKSLGQNFIHEPSVLRQIVEAAQVQPDDKVVEIGPGQGTLTEMLLSLGSAVLAVEIDERLAENLSRHFDNQKRFSLVTADILASSLRELLETRQWESETYSVVANIPYYITAPIIKKLLTDSPRPQKITLLVQKEVAERLAGTSNNRSLLSVMANYYADVTLGPIIEKHHFMPVPKVDSQVVILAPTRVFEAQEDKRFFRLVKAGFAGRRKTLANNLATLPELSKEKVEECLMHRCGWPSHIRVQELSVADWLKLAQALETL